jgi:glutathione S-transferase
METHFSFLDSQLKTSGGDYLCGKNLTGADILMSFPLMAAKERALQDSKDKYPNLLAYVQRIEKEPGYMKSVEKIVEIDGKFEAIMSM